MRASLTTLWLRNPLRVTLVLTVLNFIVWNTVAIPIPIPVTLVKVSYDLARIVLMVSAGWLVARRGSGLRDAALAGVAVLLVDHPVLRGGIFLVLHVLGHSSGENEYLMAFWGVMFSFVLFSPLAAAFGLCGGLLERRSREPSPA